MYICTLGTYIQKTTLFELKQNSMCAEGYIRPPEPKQTLCKAACLVRPLGFIHRHEFQAVKEEKGSEEQRGNDVNKIQQATESD
jgi:hypothetical protein